MENVGLHEHETVGNHYTWSNKHTNGIIYSRIDKAIYNTERFLQYATSEIEIFPPHISDHSPLMLKMNDRDMEKKKRRHNFKFQNCITEKPTYHDIVKANWEKDESGRPVYKFWRKLMKLQPDFKKLTNQVTAGVQNIQECQNMLEQTQILLAADKFNQQLIIDEKYWNEKVISSMELEEKILQQK
ncbi:uncharacterized protein LOC131637198 [Vicia villosa]|uniref:uncharacterized protein LOC131637198 n=1 Tax=Vicia villosa TaxID=3911 RepID=UPI00273A9F35|nr:uncharacterized protein LOC131637198 [Vicia villosa]